MLISKWSNTNFSSKNLPWGHFFARLVVVTPVRTLHCVFLQYCFSKTLKLQWYVYSSVSALEGLLHFLKLLGETESVVIDEWQVPLLQPSSPETSMTAHLQPFSYVIKIVQGITNTENVRGPRKASQLLNCLHLRSTMCRLKIHLEFSEAST